MGATSDSTQSRASLNSTITTLADSEARVLRERDEVFQERNTFRDIVLEAMALLQKQEMTLRRQREIIARQRDSIRQLLEIDSHHVQGVEEADA